MKPLVGRVYVLSNPVMPGLVKIGHTHLKVEDRLAELRTTGVPGRFKIEYQAECRAAKSVEKQVHNALAAHRFQSDREYFKVSREEARRVIRQYAGDILQEEAAFPIETWETRPQYSPKEWQEALEAERAPKSTSLRERHQWELDRRYAKK